MKRNLKLLAAFLVGAALAIFTSWAGGLEFERGPPAVRVIACAFGMGVYFAVMANILLKDDR